MTALHRAPMRPPAAPATHSLEAPAEASAHGGIGLALGGGFARGFAHLGVLQVLEENRIPISCIAGTSIGSILGAAYASGVPLERIAAIGRTIRFRDFARWRISRLGLASNDRMAELIHRWFRALTFEELRIPTAVVATDLGTGEPVVFTRGELVDAIRASCAYPGLFEPVYLGGQCLADGALVAPVPTRAAAEMGAACVVGVCVCADAWTGEAPKNLFQIFTRAIAVAQKDQGDSWRGMAQLVIEPAVQHIDWDQFGRADEAVAAGISAARQVLPLIQNLPRPLSPSQTTGLPQPAGTTGGTTAEMLP